MIVPKIVLTLQEHASTWLYNLLQSPHLLANILYCQLFRCHLIFFFYSLWVNTKESSEFCIYFFPLKDSHQSKGDHKFKESFIKTICWKKKAILLTQNTNI